MVKTFLALSLVSYSAQASFSTRSTGAYPVGVPQSFPEAPTYVQASQSNTNVDKCPAIPELAKAIDALKQDDSAISGAATPAGLSCLNGAPPPENNLKILRSASKIPPNGGYKYQGKGAKPLNFDLDPCSATPLTMKEDGSYCSGGPYATLLLAYPEYVCNGSSTLDQGKFGLGSKLFTTLNNDGTQMGDLAPAANIGSVITKEPGLEVMTNLGVCPGDYVNFSRPINDDGKMYGHSAVFMGLIDGKMYWWSSQSASDGWGFDCIDIEKVSSGDFAITRIDRPENLATYNPSDLNTERPQYVSGEKPPHTSKQGI